MGLFFPLLFPMSAVSVWTYISMHIRQGINVQHRVFHPLSISLANVSQLHTVVIIWGFKTDPHSNARKTKTSGKHIKADTLPTTHQQLFHASLTLLQVDAFDRHLLLPRLAERSLDNRSGTTPYGNSVQSKCIGRKETTTFGETNTTKF